MRTLVVWRACSTACGVPQPTHTHTAVFHSPHTHTLAVTSGIVSTGAVYTAKFSRKGAYLASGSFDKTVRLWTWAWEEGRATTRDVVTLAEHTLNVSVLSWGCDDTFLVSGTPSFMTSDDVLRRCLVLVSCLCVSCICVSLLTRQDVLSLSNFTFVQPRMGGCVEEGRATENAHRQNLGDQVRQGGTSVARTRRL